MCSETPTDVSIKQRRLNSLANGVPSRSRPRPGPKDRHNGTVFTESITYIQRQQNGVPGEIRRTIEVYEDAKTLDANLQYPNPVYENSRRHDTEDPTQCVRDLALPQG